jgi:hypothetical protein
VTVLKALLTAENACGVRDAARLVYGTRYKTFVADGMLALRAVMQRDGVSVFEAVLVCARMAEDDGPTSMMLVAAACEVIEEEDGVTVREKTVPAARERGGEGNA